MVTPPWFLFVEMTWVVPPERELCEVEETAKEPP